MVMIHQLTETETAASPYKVGYLFRVDHQAKELVEAGRPIPIHKEGFKY
ncbi:MAG: hypothetical protein QGG39_08910 [Candidatus Poribacteria bacterium]|nr:hypothetical protein [Candidatus Poribacteria bacterium]